MAIHTPYLFEPHIAALPIVNSELKFPVRRVYCVGRNYVEHIREMKEGDERDPPFFFQKPADAVVQNGATIPYPAATDDFQYEVELVAAIGKGGRHIGKDRALDHVFGYAVGIDLTRRDQQREARIKQLPWEPGKAFDHSAPCAALSRAADIGPLAKAAITLSVNGTVKQRGDLGQMIWNTAEIIANLSGQYELAAGDLIFTGTPAGVGPVEPGDAIEASIVGLPPLRIAIGPKDA